MPRTLRMDEKEIREARIVGIPEYIVGKMAQGIEPTEQEKDMINKYGKEYVSVHTREGKRVKPHLRDLPGGLKYSVKSNNPNNEEKLERHEFYAPHGKDEDKSMIVMDWMTDDGECSFESGDSLGEIGYIEEGTKEDIECLREEYYERLKIVEEYLPDEYEYPLGYNQNYWDNEDIINAIKSLREIYKIKRYGD